MRHYECQCGICKTRLQIAFSGEPYPEPGDTLTHRCSVCRQDTVFTRTLTKKALAQQRSDQAEQALRQEITRLCSGHGFRCRFLYQSVIITTDLSDWCFDYHQPKITLYHESTVPIHFPTGDYARSHLQFRDRKMTLPEVIDYIAAHEQWRREQPAGK